MIDTLGTLRRELVDELLPTITTIVDAGLITGYFVGDKRVKKNEIAWDVVAAGENGNIALYLGEACMWSAKPKKARDDDSEEVVFDRMVKGIQRVLCREDARLMPLALDALIRHLSAGIAALSGLRASDLDKAKHDHIDATLTQTVVDLIAEAQA